MSEEQTVAEETDAGAENQQPVEDSGAQDDDFDKLLSQYDSETKPETKPDTDNETVRKQVRAEMEFQRDLESTVKAIKGDLPLEEDFVNDWVELQAQKDPRIAQAFMDRRTKPDDWKKVMQGLSGRIRKNFVMKDNLDHDATASREAVEAAVRGSSNKAPAEETPVYGRSGNNEFRQDVFKKYGYFPSV